MPFHFQFLPYIKTHHPKTFSILKTLHSFLYTLIMDPQNDAVAADPPPPPPPFDALIPAVPISYPLKTLDELESRAYFDSFHYPFNRSTVKLSDADLLKRPRILVCHDMAGGYTKDDRFVQGAGNVDAYGVWHWYLIDVFVYFSHNLVTLPPPCWTNAAHKHGVKVLGTFIMEWDEGKINADKLLSTKESAQLYASRLTELAVALGFDGWLLNMEVNLDPAQIPILKEFVSYLTQTMHASLPGSLVIWYDSVTIDGRLSWQNQLNDKNKPFFDLSDGIFVNYGWQEDYPKKSADVAGDRKYDVYMGIDVFGRGTYGGGQWNTNVALDVIKKNDVSAAIFAPGWVYEANQPPDFETAQNRWWGLVEKSWGLVQNYPKVLPFYSNFDQGRGNHVYVDGEQISDTPWNNISSQSFQPFIKYSEDTTQPIRVKINFETAPFNGGGNITFTGSLDDNSEFTARLFEGALPVGNLPVHLTYSVKSSGNSLLGIALNFTSLTEEKNESVFLAASGNTLLTMNKFSSRFTSVIMPRLVTNHENGWVIQESNIQVNAPILKEIRAVCYKSKPEKTFPVSAENDYVIPSDFYAASLGDFKITAFGENISEFPPSSAWLVDAQFANWTSDSEGSKYLSVKIVWILKAGNADVFPKYIIYVDKVNGVSCGDESEVDNEYLGVALVKSFYISDLEVPTGTSSLKIVVQVCGHDGGRQKLEDCPFFVLEVQDS